MPQNALLILLVDWIKKDILDLINRHFADFQPIK